MIFRITCALCFVLLVSSIGFAQPEGGLPGLADLFLQEHSINGQHSVIHAEDVITIGPWVDVRAFLPVDYVEDGSEDYSYYFQEAVNSMIYGGELRIPVGIWQARFTIPSSVAVPEYTRPIAIRGIRSEPGTNDGTVLKSPPGTEPVISGIGVREIVIDGLNIDCDGQASAGIDIDSCFRSQFSNINIYRSSDKGFAVYSAPGHPHGGVYYNLFENILAYQCDGPGFYHHADPAYCNSNTWINCSAARNGQKDTGTSRYGFDLKGVYNSVFQGCTSEHNRYDHGVHADYCIKCKWIGGTYEGNGEDALDPASKYQIYIADNYGYGCEVDTNYYNENTRRLFMSGVDSQKSRARLGEVEFGNLYMKPANGRYQEIWHDGLLIMSHPDDIEVFGIKNAGHKYPPFFIKCEGRLCWRGHTLDAHDVELYRNVADQLKTDDQLLCADGIVTKVKDGAISDADFTVDTDGLLAIDSENGRIYFRYGGAWHYVNQAAGFQIPREEVAGLREGDIVIGKIDGFMSDGAAHARYIPLKEALKELGVKFEDKEEMTK